MIPNRFLSNMESRVSVILLVIPIQSFSVERKFIKSIVRQ